MSGGSYNYLCHTFDLESLVAHRHNLRDMAERLGRLGWAKDAAVETRTLLADLDALEVHHEATRERLYEVWKAVEWWDSCDWSEDQVRTALLKYRGVDVTATEAPKGLPVAAERTEP